MISKGQKIKSDAMRARLVEKARLLFGKRGYERTSQAAICSAAGVSRGALNHHFAGKGELFEAVVHDILDEFEIPAPLDDFEHGLRQYFEKALDPAVFRITIEDAPKTLGLEKWRRIETSYFVEPLLSHGFPRLAARMTYGALLEATMEAHASDNPDDIISEAILILKKHRDDGLRGI